MNKLSQLLILSLATAIASPASGQVFFGGRPDRGATTAKQKKAFERELATKIGDMKRACKLSDVQVKKLQLAAKGAVVSSMEKFKAEQKKMRQQMRAMGANIPGFEIEEEEDADEGDGEDDDAGGEDDEAGAEDENVDGPIEVALNAINIVGGPRSNNVSVSDEARWRKAVSSVLTSEQKAAYDKAVKEREAFVRKTAVASFVARVDLKLLLSAEQRQKLTGLIDKNFGKQLAKKVGQSAQNVFFINRAGGRAAPPISHKELKPLLSEAQLGEWQSSFEPELNRLKGGGFGGGGGVFRNVVIDPIELAVPDAIQIERDDK